MSMKIVVIGGTGLIGSKVVEKVRAKGSEPAAGAPNTSVNYGITVSETTLIPGDDARLDETGFETWLSQYANQIPATTQQPAIEKGAGSKRL